MAFRTQSDIEDLARAFNECSLPKSEWTHAAHLVVGLWHVERYGRDDALIRLRAGIRGPLAHKDLLLAFYSRPRLFCAEARLGWVEPDVAPFVLEELPHT